jgi:hypothetical protein
MRDLATTVILLAAMQGAVLAPVLWLRKANHLAKRILGVLVAAVALLLLLRDLERRFGFSGHSTRVFANVRHSALYRSTFYAGAKDGWYAASGSSVHAGLRGGVRLGAAETYAKVGVAATGALNGTMPPFYGTVGSTYAF